MNDPHDHIGDAWLCRLPELNSCSDCGVSFNDVLHVDMHDAKRCPDCARVARDNASLSECCAKPVHTALYSKVRYCTNCLEDVK